MGLFSSSKKERSHDTDFDIEASEEPPLVTATPITYASGSLPTPAEAIFNATINNASAAASNQLPQPFGRHPITIPQCSQCSQPNITTRTSTYPSIETWIMCGVLLLIFWPICWIPLVMDSAKRTDHICTSCQNVVGVVKPMSDCCVKERG